MDEAPALSPDWEADEEGEDFAELGLQEQRRSPKAGCARRSIEQYQERRRLKMWLTDVFDEDDLEADVNGHELLEED